MPCTARTRALCCETEPWGYTGDMVDNTEKKKAPMATWLIATIALGLIIMLAIGVAVL